MDKIKKEGCPPAHLSCQSPHWPVHRRNHSHHLAVCIPGHHQGTRDPGFQRHAQSGFVKKWRDSGRCEVHRVPLDTAIDDDAGEVALVVAWFGLQQ